MSTKAACDILIAPGRGGLFGAAAECWQYRELLYFLAWRDVKVRYKQTLLGASWAVLQPLVTMVVFTLVFHKMAGVKAPGATPYVVFAFAGLLPWQLFQSALTESSSSMVAEGRLITRVYFPRLLVPLAAVVSGLVDFCISLVILTGLMLYFGIAPALTAVLVPVYMLLAVLSALSLGVWLAALNVKYRDFRYVVPFGVRLLMFLSPVAYPAAKLIGILPAGWGWVYYLNPVAGVLEGFKAAVLGGATDVHALVLSVCISLVLLIGGLVYFRSVERTFADLV